MSDENRGAKGAPGFDIGGRVLVVDDERTARNLHRGILARQFDVLTAESGEEALRVMEAFKPDLVVLDIEMAGIDGFETCRRLRQSSSVPVLFVTGHSELAVQLDAYEAGGNDIVTKPILPEVFLRKAALAIRAHSERNELQERNQSLQSMAMGFLSSMGENGILLNFLRASVQCRSYDELTGRLAEAVRELGVQCHGELRHGSGVTRFSTSGKPTPLEESVIAQLMGMGRIFQFHNQLVVNYERISVVITGLPGEDKERAGRIRDNVAILAETVEALCDNVDMRQESMNRAEQLQVALISAVKAIDSLKGRHFAMLGDTRLLLHELSENIERTFSWLATTREQEVAISETIDRSVQAILALLATSGQFNEEFNAVLKALRGAHTEPELELW